jgi:hypothetical protein
MALSSDPFDSTELAASIPEIWTPIVNEAFFDKTVLADFITDLSSYATGGGDIFHVPDLFTNTFGAQTQTTQATEVTTEAPAQVDIYLTINTHKYVAFLIGDMDLQLVVQKYDLNSKYAKEAAGVLATALEASIAGLWSSISTNAVGDTATYITDAEVRQAIEKLDSSNYDLNECAFFFHPYVYWNQIFAIAKFYTSATLGNANSAGPVMTGNFGSSATKSNYKGMLYGIPIYTSTNIVSGLQTYRNLLLHKSAFGMALRTLGSNRVRVQSQNWLENIALLTVVDIIYGVAVLREPGAVLINASNTYIAS